MCLIFKNVLKFVITNVATFVLELEAGLIQEYIQTKNERIANEIVRTYRKFVFATALRYIDDYDDADDIAQEVFIKVLQNINKFEGKSSFKTWIYRITVNTSINYRRRKKFVSFFSFGEDVIENKLNVSDNNIESEIENKEFQENFKKALMKLPEKQRETFALRYFDEMPYEDISKMVGTSVGGLKANYHLAVKKIADMINSKEILG